MKPSFMTIGLVRSVLMDPSESKRLEVIRPCGSRLREAMLAVSRVQAKRVAYFKQKPTMSPIRSSIERIGCFEINLNIFRQDLFSMTILIAVINSVKITHSN